MLLGFRYLKAPATTFVLQFQNGKLVRKGPGLSFWYFGPTNVIAEVPVSSVDVPFAFNEVSNDFQEVTLQGNITYRVTDPEKLSALLDYSVITPGLYRTDDPRKLSERLTQAAQTSARGFVQSRPLRELLSITDELTGKISAGLKSSQTVADLGVTVISVVVTSVKPEAEMAKALQAEAREQLLRKADEAIYARRNASVELERTIRENELNTEIAVAQKERQVRETQMQGEIAVEQQRTTYVETRVANELKEAEAHGAALSAVLAPVRDVDWRTLMAMQGRMESGTLISSAFEQLSANAEKIGQLNITPELLQSLLGQNRSQVQDKPDKRSQRG